MSRNKRLDDIMGKINDNIINQNYTNFYKFLSKASPYQKIKTKKIIQKKFKNQKIKIKKMNWINIKFSKKKEHILHIIHMLTKKKIKKFYQID